MVVPEGKHEISFRYCPTITVISIIINFVFVLLVIIIICGELKKDVEDKSV